MRYIFLLLAVRLLAELPCEAASVAPELDALAAKYAAIQAPLSDASSRQVEAARGRYLQALVAARVEMQKTNRGGAVIAIDAEIDDLKGDVHGVPAADLPHSLLPARREYLTALESIEKEYGARAEENRKRYVTSLSAMSQLAKTQNNQPLLEAIARAMEAASAPNKQSGGAGLHHNAIINGGFSKGEVGKMPTGWKPKGASFQGENVPWQNDAMIVQEGAERFLRFRRLGSVRLANVAPVLPILIPDRAKAAVVSLRIRVEGLVPGKDYDRFPGAFIRALDVTGKSPGVASAVAIENTRWKKYTARLTLQPGAKTLELAVGPAAAAGICDFDDIEVKFE